MSAPAADRPLRAQGVSVRRSSEDIMVLAPGPEAEFVLNPTAFALWQLCDGETTVEEMVEAVVQLFLITREQAARDVSAAVQRMRGAGLIR